MVSESLDLGTTEPAPAGRGRIISIEVNLSSLLSISRIWADEATNLVFP